jgi:hypothetical protein
MALIAQREPTVFGSAATLSMADANAVDADRKLTRVFNHLLNY